MIGGVGWNADHRQPVISLGASGHETTACSSEITEPSEAALAGGKFTCRVTSSSRSEVSRSHSPMLASTHQLGRLSVSLIPHRVKLCSPKVEVGQTLASLIRLLVDMNITNHAIKRAGMILRPMRALTFSHPIRWLGDELKDCRIAFAWRPWTANRTSCGET